MKSEFNERSVDEYRQKFREIRKKAKKAEARGDETAKRSYDALARGWRAMMEHAESNGRGSVALKSIDSDYASDAASGK